jgi:transposase-like protein
MPDSHSHSTVPSLTVIEHPHCPNCKQTRMSLARIGPGPKGFDIRTFECSKCDRVHIISVEKDPMKSAKANWIHGDLNGPK